LEASAAPWRLANGAPSWASLSPSSPFDKKRIEEGRMRETFPEYEGYRRDTKAIIPFVF